MADDKTMEIVERLARIETMLQSDVKALNERVSKLENANTWLSRTVGAIIIGAMMSLVVIGSK